MTLSERGKRLKENVPVWYEKVIYRGNGKVTDVNRALTVAPPKETKAKPDPWYLVTNLGRKK